MEVILLRLYNGMYNYEVESFNPCFYGSYSFTYQKMIVYNIKYKSFNPCFYGSYSFTIIWRD